MDVFHYTASDASLIKNDTYRPRFVASDRPRTKRGRPRITNYALDLDACNEGEFVAVLCSNLILSFGLFLSFTLLRY